jgi:hypothetical protein
MPSFWTAIISLFIGFNQRGACGFDGFDIACLPC